MNREDVIRWAREAGFEPEIVLEGPYAPYAEEWLCNMERFFQAAYAAGAAAERDRMCEQFNIPKELAHEKATSNETD